MRNLLSRLRTLFVSRLSPPYRISGPGYREYYYREGNHRVTIHYESTLGDPHGDMMIDRGSLVRWDVPHSDELISEAKREEIMERFGAYLTKNKMCYWFNWNEQYEEAERQRTLEEQLSKNVQCRD